MENKVNGPPNGCSDPLERFLRDAGAGELGHKHGRTLLDHLVGTRAIVGRWLQPQWVEDAAALHSVYGTDVYRRRLISVTGRDRIRAMAGERAERLAYLFGAVERRTLFAWFEAPAGHLGGGLTFDTRFPGETGSETLNWQEAGHLLVLHMANLAEQARDPDGLPGDWLARVSRWGSMLGPAGLPAPAIFGGCSSAVSPDDERKALASYLAGLHTPADRQVAAADHFSTASKLCPWVGEPWVWRAWLALAARQDCDARLFAAEARRRFVELGTCWDKRLPYERWLVAADILEECAILQLGGQMPPLDMGQPADSFDVLSAFASTRGADGRRSQDYTGRQRFSAYIEAFAGKPKIKRLRHYPGLTSRPWHDERQFELATALEGSYPEIRQEISKVGRVTFRPESEPISRTGSWDVLMLFEHGRKHDETCALCPATTRLIESDPRTPTAAGLIYFSRMAPGTHVAAHHGPTNMRLRCHLGIQIPAGDCGVRVAGEVRRWQEGRCLVFDDHFKHEAWNHTSEDRLVLVVDFWHPELSDREIALLWGLDHYAWSYARRMERRRANAQAAPAR